MKNGKVKDEAYYEELAQQRGVSVKTAQQADKAAARAEGYAPKGRHRAEGVNGKGGAVLDRAITAADVGAVERAAGDYLKGNRGNYRLRIEQRGEWKGLTVCAHWHPGASAATLVENGVLTVPAAVTAVPGVGCITFEGTDGSCTVTSADVRCKVCANSGTAEGAMPAPATPAGKRW